MSPSAAINMLLGSGWTEVSIARAVDVSQPTINRIKHGASPSFGVGSALVQLAAKPKRKSPSKPARAAKAA